MLSICALKTLQGVAQKRRFWQWINIIFNKVDDDRRRMWGPDRTCAEWILRNGGAVKFVGANEYVRNYNALPVEGTRFTIKEVDATESSIMHYGFPHFQGCKFIEKAIFDKCDYLEDVAFKELSPLKNSLTYLQISGCQNITDEGLMSLESLSNLKTLIIYNLTYVKDKNAVVKNLKSKLAQCDINFK